MADPNDQPRDGNLLRTIRLQAISEEQKRQEAELRDRWGAEKFDSLWDHIWPYMLRAASNRSSSIPILACSLDQWYMGITGVTIEASPNKLQTIAMHILRVSTLPDGITLSGGRVCWT